MNTTKQIAQQLILQPVAVQYNNKFSIVQKIAGLLLLSLFLFLGIGIIRLGLEAEEYGIYYLLFGAVFCLFPLFVYLIMQQYKNQLITLITFDGISLKNDVVYKWENLQSITFYSSLYEQNESNRFISIQFNFKNGKAVSTHKADQFSYTLFIANNLPVPKNEKSFTYFK